jgi:hypothetical protein
MFPQEQQLRQQPPSSRPNKQKVVPPGADAKPEASGGTYGCYVTFLCPSLFTPVAGVLHYFPSRVFLSGSFAFLMLQI